MTNIVVVKNDQGKLEGFREPDKRAYRRFRKKLDEMEVGELIQFAVQFPRNPKLHRLHFQVIGSIFEQQERFDKAEDLRHYLYVGAGHCDYLPVGKRGRVMAVPRSVSYHSIDDEAFHALHEAVLGFARSKRCCRYLWESVPVSASLDGMAEILDAFEHDSARAP